MSGRAGTSQIDQICTAFGRLCHPSSAGQNECLFVSRGLRGWRIWVMAAMWMAWLIRRFPRRLSPRALAGAGGDLDRRGAVAGGEAVAVLEAGHVADLVDDGRGDDRANTEQAGQAGPAGSDGVGELLLGLAQLPVNAAFGRFSGARVIGVRW
jgi:hypothetical protein